MRLGEHDRALADCDRAIQINPHSITAYRHRGEIYAQTGQHKIAINDLNRALEMVPRDSLNLFTRSYFYYELRDFKNALVDLVNGMKVSTTPLVIFNNPGNDIDLYKKAVADMTGYLRSNPAAAGAYFFRALAFEKLKDTAKAISDCTLAIQCDPTLAVAYFKRSALYLYNEPQKALMDLDRTIELDNSWVFPLKLRASMHSSTGENDLALLDLTRIIQLQPRTAESYVQRSQLLVAMKRYDEAILDCDRALAIDPRNQPSYYYRGIAHAEKPVPDLTRAIADESMAIQLDPMDAKALSQRATRYLTLEQPENALTDLQQAVMVTRDPTLKASLMKMVNSINRKQKS